MQFGANNAQGSSYSSNEHRCQLERSRRHCSSFESVYLECVRSLCAIGAIGRAYDHGRNNSGFGTPVNPPVNIAHLDNDVAGM